MIGITNYLTPNLAYTTNDKADLIYPKKDKHPHPYIPRLSKECITQPQIKQKTIQKKTFSLWKLVPFTGTYNYFKENKVKEIGRVKPEDICKDTAVITLNNKHAGALMGGVDEYLDLKEKTNHVILFGGIPGTQQPLTKLLEIKLELSLAIGLVYGSTFALSSLIPANVAEFAAWGICIKVFEKLGFENPLLSILELQNLKGVSADSLKESTYKPIPLVGLDTYAMRKRASEIKERGEYNSITKNCSWAVLECIKSGLPTEVVKKLPSTGLYVTPTDVENIVSFLVENNYLLLGEMDEEGVAWFDAQTYPS